MDIKDRAEQFYAVLSRSPGLLAAVSNDGKLNVGIDIIMAIGQSGLEVTELVADGFMTEPAAGESTIDIKAIVNVIDPPSKSRVSRKKAKPSEPIELDKKSCAEILKKFLVEKGLWKDPVPQLQEEGTRSPNMVHVSKEHLNALEQLGATPVLIQKYNLGLVTPHGEQGMLSPNDIDRAINSPESGQEPSKAQR